MNALQTLLACADRGVSVRVSEDGETLEVSPRENLTPELRAALRENKAEILNGKRPPAEYEILNTFPPPPGLHAEYSSRVSIPEEHLQYLPEGEYVGCIRELVPVLAMAHIRDRESGPEWVEGMVFRFGYVGLHSAERAVEGGLDTGFDDYVPAERLAETQEEIECNNRAVRARVAQLKRDAAENNIFREGVSAM